MANTIEEDYENTIMNKKTGDTTTATVKLETSITNKIKKKSWICN